jgi:hypothetical protein
MLEFLLFGALPWCTCGFIAGLFRRRAYRKENVFPHQAQIWLDTAMGPLTAIGCVRKGGWT